MEVHQPTGQPIDWRQEAYFALMGAQLDLLCVAGYMRALVHGARQSLTAKHSVLQPQQT